MTIILPKLFSVAGLSLALNQICSLSSDQRRGVVSELATNKPQSSWSLPPIQSNKIDKLILKMQNQDKFWEVLPLQTADYYYLFMNRKMNEIIV